jgi:hypothetical protein
MLNIHSNTLSLHLNILVALAFVLVQKLLPVLLYYSSSHGMALLIAILVVGEYLVPCVNCYVQVVAVPLTGYLLRVQLASFFLYPVLKKFSKWRVHYLTYVLLLANDST